MGGFGTWLPLDERWKRKSGSDRAWFTDRFPNKFVLLEQGDG
jgi:hypothetical protein